MNYTFQRVSSIITVTFGHKNAHRKTTHDISEGFVATEALKAHNDLLPRRPQLHDFVECSNSIKKKKEKTAACTLEFTVIRTQKCKEQGPRWGRQLKQRFGPLLPDSCPLWPPASCSHYARSCVFVLEIIAVALFIHTAALLGPRVKTSGPLSGPLYEYSRTIF